MRSFALLGLSALVSASSERSVESEVVSSVPSAVDIAPEITIVKEASSYAVKLECVGCPFPVWKNHMTAEWQHAPPNNSLILKFDIDESRTALLLDGQRIQPLDPMPLHLNAVQIPSDITQDDMDEQIERGSWSSMPKRMTYPLQYEHTIFRARKNGFLWVQVNVTGVAFGERIGPVTMGQRIVQIMLRETHHREEVDDGETEYSTTLSIADINVVGAAKRVHPPRMNCGKPAMVQTMFDPNEWDEDGKLGTWSRTWNIVIAKLGDFFQHNALLLPLNCLLAICLVMGRHLYQSRQQERLCREDAETAALGRDDDDTPPPYADIPVIKIEEYD